MVGLRPGVCRSLGTRKVFGSAKRLWALPLITAWSASTESAGTARDWKGRRPPGDRRRYGEKQQNAPLRITPQDCLSQLAGRASCNNARAAAPKLEARAKDNGRIKKTSRVHFLHRTESWSFPQKPEKKLSCCPRGSGCYKRARKIVAPKGERRIVRIIPVNLRGNEE